jgi:hypothetical protein
MPTNNKKRKQRGNDDKEESKDDNSRAPPPVWNCPKCNKCFQGGLTRAALSHDRCCFRNTEMTGTSFSLESVDDPVLQQERSRLSLFNQLVTESIELVEASTNDIELLLAKSRNLKRKPIPGNIGIRCRHCFLEGTAATGAICYPAELKNLPFNAYNMATRHLIKTCQSISEDMRNEIRLAQKTSTSESARTESLGLPEYLRMIANKYGLVTKEVGKEENTDENGDNNKQGIIIRRSDQGDYPCSDGKHSTTVLETSLETWV